MKVPLRSTTPAVIAAVWTACFLTNASAAPPPLPKKAEDILKIYEEMLPKTTRPEALAKLKGTVLSVLDGEITTEAARDKKSPVMQALLERRMGIAPLDLAKLNLYGLKPEPDGIKVLDGLPLATPCLLSPPIKLEATVKATKGEMRLVAGADQIIFGWAGNLSEIRIDGGPANQRHVANQGRIPTNSFFTVEQVITDTSMVIKIDGKVRGKWLGDFSKISEEVGMFTVAGSQLTVKHCKVSGKVTGMVK
jgi:hypothetical protein